MAKPTKEQRERAREALTILANEAARLSKGSVRRVEGGPAGEKCVLRG